MGIFDKIFKSERDVAKEEIKKVPWQELREMEQLDKIVEESHSNVVGILKHSTRCGVSKMVLRRFENEYELQEENEIVLYFLDLLQHRDISDEIATRFNVRHESPQLLILKGGEVVHHSSHQDVEADTFKKFLK